MRVTNKGGEGPHNEKFEFLFCATGLLWGLWGSPIMSEKSFILPPKDQKRALGADNGIIYTARKSKTEGRIRTSKHTKATS